MNAQRALLDQLMGKHRNLAADEKPEETRWDDESVCPWFIAGFCPHDLFTNTKSDLGPCPLEHEKSLREQYEKEILEDPRIKEELDSRFLARLQGLCRDIDITIRRHNQRLEADGPTLQDFLSPEEREQLGKLEEQIASLLKQMETLGEEGKVDESQQLLVVVDTLRQKKASLENAANSTRLGNDISKSQEVCDICGAILVKNDVEQRIMSHLEGKMHMGFKRIRDKITELITAGIRPSTHGSSRRSNRRSRSRSPRRSRRRSRSRDRYDRRGGRDRDRYSRDSRSRHRRDSRDRDYHRRRRRSYSRSRSRSRSHSRDRSRSRSRGRHSRKH